MVNSSFLEKEEASRYALPLNLFIQLKQENKLHLSVPKEECTCGDIDGALSSLLSQYNVDDLIRIKKPEYKKGKELFLICLFAYLIRESDNKKHQYDICLPLKDRGIDAYIREIDYKNSLITHHPIQICEMPEKYLRQKVRNTDPAKWVFDFIKKTKLKHYPKSVDALLVWLEFESNKFIDIAALRRFMLEETTNPFKQIVIMGRGQGDLFNVCSIYSSNLENSFCFQHNYKTKKSVAYNII